MKKISIIILLLISSVSSWGWDDKDTHPRITEYTINMLFDPEFLKQEYMLDGVIKKATFWFQDGSRLEDDGTLAGYVTGSARSLYHFHDPTKPLIEAGLSDLPLPPKMSTVLWAQNTAQQSGATGGDWSWQKVREHQYAYLTALSKTNEDTSLARMLMGLGYQMHLIQDMSQPNHVRNDTHIDDGKAKKPIYGFETWAKTNFGSVNAILTNYSSVIKKTATVDLTTAYEGGLAPVARLYDTRNNLRVDTSVVPNMTYITPSISFSQGLAEYTNANFYSEDSIFAAERHAVGNRYFFPYPQKEETDVQKFIDKSLSTIPFFDRNKTYQNFRISKTATTGESLDCIAKPTNSTAKYYKTLGEGEFFYGSFVADEECFEEQATKLLPRAAGYSIALLEYFFRGDLTVSTPTDTPPTTKHILLNVRNSTATAEAMDGGSIELMAIFQPYKKNGSVFSGTLVPDGDKQSRKYTLGDCTRQNPVCTINTTDTLLDFDLSSAPLPPLARDIILILVYRGKLGKETDSVAFGEIFLDGINSELNLSLPARGVYASQSGDDLSRTFTDFALAARNNSTVPSTAGSAELMVIYRDTTEDPFQSQPVTSSSDIKYVGATVTTSNGISTSATTALQYLLADGIPIKATDVSVYLKHTDSNLFVTYGYRDISEPTPVDIYNSTDYTCINNTWHRYDDPVATAILYSSNTYPQNIVNISYLAAPADAGTLDPTASNTLFAAGPLPYGQKQRLGYILTDYTNSYAFSATKAGNGYYPPLTTIPQTNPGLGFRNDGDVQDPMFVIRGTKMWGGNGVVVTNHEYPSGSNCSWEDLNLLAGQ